MATSEISCLWTWRPAEFGNKELREYARTLADAMTTLYKLLVHFEYKIL
jgi:hypothetical protein